MGKKKNKKRKQERKFLAQQFSQQIEEKKAEALERSKRSKYKIPKEFEVIKVEEEEITKISQECYRLVFKYYNNTLCGIVDINQASQSSSLIQKLDALSSTPANKIQQFIRDTVHRENAKNQYAHLFDGLSEDIDQIHETQFAGTGRVFFFTVENPQGNYISVVSINQLHLE